MPVSVAASLCRSRRSASFSRRIAFSGSPLVTACMSPRHTKYHVAACTMWKSPPDENLPCRRSQMPTTCRRNLFLNVATAPEVATLHRNLSPAALGFRAR